MPDFIDRKSKIDNNNNPINNRQNPPRLNKPAKRTLRQISTSDDHHSLLHYVNGNNETYKNAALKRLCNHIIPNTTNNLGLLRNCMRENLPENLKETAKAKLENIIPTMNTLENSWGQQDRNNCIFIFSDNQTIDSGTGETALIDIIRDETLPRKTRVIAIDRMRIAAPTALNHIHTGVPNILSPVNLNYNDISKATEDITGKLQQTECVISTEDKNNLAEPVALKRKDNAYDLYDLKNLLNWVKSHHNNPINREPLIVSQLSDPDNNLLFRLK